MKRSPIIYILLLGLILRLVNINQSLWLDEATSAVVARDYNWGGIWSNFLPKDFHPPLYYFALKAWSLIFGTSEIALRMMSVVFGIAAIWMIYLIGKLAKSRSLGTVAALFLATGPLHIYYSQEVRMYMMSLFLIECAIYFFLCKKWLWFGMSLATVGLTDYLPLFIVPIFWIYGYITRSNYKWWKSFILSHIFLLAAFIVILPIFTSQVTGGFEVKTLVAGWWNILGGTSIKNALLIPVKFVIGRISFPRLIYVGVVGFSLSLFGFVMYPSFRLKKYRFFVLWMILPILFALVIGLFLPVLTYFRLLFVLPAVYFLLATGLMERDDKFFFPFLGAILLMNVLFSARYLANSRFQREDWRGFTAFVNNNSGGKSIIIFPANSQMEALNFYKPAIPYSGPIENYRDYEEIWLMRYVWDVFDPGDKVRETIERSGFMKQSEHNFNGVLVYKYENSN